MNEKQISIIGFSICDVRGFKTIVAGKTPSEKRINSAVNYLDRIFKQHEKEILAKEDKSGLAGVKHCISTITQVRALSPADNKTVFTVNDDPVIFLSTDESFAKVEEIYENNIRLFIESAVTIAAKVKEHRNEKDVGEELTSDDYNSNIPKLYMCTGGMFGQEPFPIIVTDRSLETKKAASVEDAVRIICLRSVQVAKSRMLSDFIRLEKPELKEKYKQGVITSDRLIDTINEIEVKFISLLSPASTGKATHVSRLGYDHLKKLAVTLEFENALLLADHIRKASIGSL